MDLYSTFVQGSNLTGYSYGLVRLPFVLVLRKTDKTRIFTCVWICTDFLYKVHLQKGYSNSLVQLSFVLELRKTNRDVDVAADEKVESHLDPWRIVFTYFLVTSKKARFHR